LINLDSISTITGMLDFPIINASMHQWRFCNFRFDLDAGFSPLPLFIFIPSRSIALAPHDCSLGHHPHASRPIRAA
jgi:hypothetical protein